MRASSLALVLVLLVAGLVVVWLARESHDASSEIPAQPPETTREDTEALSAPLERESREVAAPPVVAAAVGAATTAAKTIDELPPGDHDDFPPRIESPPGVLEVQVEDRDGPLADVDVELWEPSDDRQSAWPAPGAPGSRSTHTDSTGLATFQPPPAKHCAVRVTAPGGIVVTRRIEVSPEQTKLYRVFVRFGNAVVFGRVFMPGGTPDSNAEVWMDQGGNQRVLRTDARGEYRFEKVRERFTLVVARSTPLRNPDGGPEVFTVEVGRARFVPRVGEVRRVDFGDAEPPCTWAGRLMTKSGAALPWPLAISLDGVRDGNVIQLTTDGDGRFSIEMRPGEYRATILSSPRNIELGHVSVRGQSLVLDLVVPGICVRGSLHHIGTRAGGLPPLMLHAYRMDVPDAKPFRARIGQEEYCLLDLEPAIYRVRVASNSPLAGAPKLRIVDAPDDGFELDLRASKGFETRDLVLSDR